MIRPGAAALLLAALPAQAETACATASTGARCIAAGEPTDGAAAEVGRRVPARQRSAPYEAGQILPAGRYFRLLNSEYYGLPPVDGDWRYYEVDGRVLRVRPDTLEVIGDATAETNRAF